MNTTTIKSSELTSAALYTIKFRSIGSTKTEITHYYAGNIVDAAVMLKDEYGYNIEIIDYVRS